jgi:predicted RNA binding protein YcfA (HicA-like mRNA interferase family)
MTVRESITMRRREIRFAEVNRFLKGLGFVSQRVPGSHVRWEHPPSGTMILLPDEGPEEIAWWNSVVAIGGMLDLHGVLPRDDFDRWLHRAGKPAAANGAPRADKRGARDAEKQGTDST